MSGYESDTCGQSYTIRIHYVWTQIFLYPHKKICGYKNLRIRVDGALLPIVFMTFSLPSASLDPKVPINSKQQARIFHDPKNP